MVQKRENQLFHIQFNSKPNQTEEPIGSLLLYIIYVYSMSRTTALQLPLSFLSLPPFVLQPYRRPLATPCRVAEIVLSLSFTHSRSLSRCKVMSLPLPSPLAHRRVASCFLFAELLDWRWVFDFLCSSLSLSLLMGTEVDFSLVWYVVIRGLGLLFCLHPECFWWYYFLFVIVFFLIKLNYTV